MQKFIFIILVSVLTGLGCEAAKPTDGIIHDKGIKVTAMIGLSYDKRKENYISVDAGVGMVASPRVGYSFNSRWEAGLMYRYENLGGIIRLPIPDGAITKEKYWAKSIYSSWGAYGEYRFASFCSDRLRLFVDFIALYNHYNTPGRTRGYVQSNTCQAGFVPGAVYRIPGCNVDLRLEYLFVGFNNQDRINLINRMDGCLGGGDWVLDAGLRRLAIGASYTF